MELWVVLQGRGLHGWKRVQPQPSQPQHSHSPLIAPPPPRPPAPAPLQLTMLNKTEGNKPIASLQIDLLPYKYVGAEDASSAGRGTSGRRFARRAASFLRKLILPPTPHPSPPARPLGAGNRMHAGRTRTAGTTFGRRCRTWNRGRLWANCTWRSRTRRSR